MKGSSGYQCVWGGWSNFMKFPVWTIPKASATKEVFQKRLNQVGEVLLLHITELRDNDPDNALLQHIDRGGFISIIVDKCGGHDKSVLDAFLQKYTFCKFLLHPSSSPDLNPAETKWRLMKQILYTFRRATSVEEYEKMVLLASDMVNKTQRLTDQISHQFRGNVMNVFTLNGGNGYHEGRRLANDQPDPLGGVKVHLNQHSRKAHCEARGEVYEERKVGKHGAIRQCEQDYMNTYAVEVGRAETNRLKAAEELLARVTQATVEARDTDEMIVRFGPGGPLEEGELELRGLMRSII